MIVVNCLGRTRYMNFCVTLLFCVKSKKAEQILPSNVHPARVGTVSRTGLAAKRTSHSSASTIAEIASIFVLALHCRTIRTPINHLKLRTSHFNGLLQNRPRQFDCPRHPHPYMGCEISRGP